MLVRRLCSCIVVVDIWHQHQKMSPQTNLLRYFLNMSVFISIQQKLYEMSPSSSLSALYNLRDRLLTRSDGVRATLYKLTWTFRFRLLFTKTFFYSIYSPTLNSKPWACPNPSWGRSKFSLQQQFMFFSNEIMAVKNCNNYFYLPDKKLQ